MSVAEVMLGRSSWGLWGVGCAGRSEEWLLSGLSFKFMIPMCGLDSGVIRSVFYSVPRFLIGNFKPLE